MAGDEVPSPHPTLSLTWFNAGPTSMALAQHLANVSLTFCVYWGQTTVYALCTLYSRHSSRMTYAWSDVFHNTHQCLYYYFVRLIVINMVNPLTAKLFNLNFHSLEVVSRWRDPQLQVSENSSDFTKWRSTVIKYCWFMSHFLFKRWYLMC